MAMSVIDVPMVEVTTAMLVLLVDDSLECWKVVRVAGGGRGRGGGSCVRVSSPSTMMTRSLALIASA